MPETYALPVEGYQQPPADPMGYALPIAQPIPADIPRVYIRPEPDVISTRDEPILHASGKQLKAIDHDPWANLGMAGVEDKSGQSEHPLLKQLFGLGGEPRVQLWPERMVRAGVTAAGNVMSGATSQWAVDPETGDVHTSPQMIEAGLDTAALAGTGGLAGTTEATLGSGPFLRPALKHEGKIYKGKEGQQHLDVLPKHLEADFNQKAMTGEDISHYNFGFMNHKGQFLNREAALNYAVKEGLIDPTAGQYGALTSTLLSDSSKPGIAIEAMKKPTFYSALEHNVNNIGQIKMTGDQWLGTLANKPGVKPEELQWTGLKEFLEENKGKVVTKEQIQQHLEQNKVELKEVSKGQEKLTVRPNEDQPNILEVYRADDPTGQHSGMVGEILQNIEHPDKFVVNVPDLPRKEFKSQADAEAYIAKNTDIASTTKYHSYQLPGGENYREMLLTLPTKSNSTADMLTLFPSILSEIKTLKDVSLARQHNANFRESFKGVEDKDILDNIALADKLSKTSDYKSSHWDEPNILAHVRMNDRTIEGKKSLHLEEIQSDWHQQGREKGYKGQAPQLTDAENTEYYGLLKKAAEKGLNEAEQARKIELGTINAKAKDETGVPDAPFKKTWHELALKRMLREAAEKGYDRLSWTPGEAQAARYDLSKTFDNIRAYTNSDGTYKVWGRPKGGQVHNIGDNVPANKLPEIVGKELADKITKQKPEIENIYSGLDLKIGGEGMKGFYDKMIPNALEKMGKEHGVKVKTSGVSDGFQAVDKKGEVVAGFKDKTSADKWVKQMGSKYEVKEKSNPVHYIDIPQSLKDTVLRKGQPLFSSAHPGITFSQVNYDPFKEDKSK